MITMKLIDIIKEFITKLLNLEVADNVEIRVSEDDTSNQNTKKEDDKLSNNESNSKPNDTKNQNSQKDTVTYTSNDKIKGLFVKSSDTGKLSFTELKNKGYTHLFISHLIFDDKGEDYVKKVHDKCKTIGTKLIIFYTTYYNGDYMVNPISPEADNRINRIITIGKKDTVDGVCLDYNRHNSSNHNDQIMNKIANNTNKVVSELKGKEVYATCMAEHPNAVKDYYHQDIAKWKATPLCMLYKYNYNYSDSKMKEIYNLLKKANSKTIAIYQNYAGDNNIKDIGSSQLNKDIIDKNKYVVFRYGTGSY